MRQTLQTPPLSHASPAALLRAARLAAAALGVGLVLTGSIARAQEAGEEDDRTFEEKLIGGLMKGIGATNMENSGIDYRERSPLVVPRNLDLPQPEASAKDVNAPNWPKDPDVQARKEARAAARRSKPTPQESARPLMPSELAAVRSDSSNKANGDPSQPGNQVNNPMLSPSQLGFNGSLSSLFGGGNKAETAPFTGEPTRETLTQPPVGYQTPSPNFAYGTGPKEALGNKRIDVMTGKEVSN
ncbi:hypothetical protein IP86_25715 [Rhodopseudomonas sp. AAP120]|uniref:hypothetical protein n=1 Tax=Rhodopseudomonas sp. AAP120 TaxID=1523430 RepID=UPI0006B90FB7|nr:hypothetical protein [Rhodopseudomonas sp. AAP120]KPF90560.1 hypothetical protein IP86_25715 [Rhodopseudomonas sp. AAP120]